MKISFVKIYLYSFLFCLLALCCLSSPARAAITSCQQYDSSTTVKSGFGVPYNTLSAAKETIINGDFDDASVQVTVNLGNGSSQMYIYNQGYIWRGGAWQPVSLAAGSKGSSGSWRIGRASAVITTTAAELSSGFYVIAHICSWTGTAWKCGCRDSACATPYWQLQRFQHAASPVCGNGHCESGSGETCSTCSTDCGPCSGSDTTAPVVSSFSVAPTSLSAGSQITASYSVTDNAALASVELFRAPSGVNCSDTTKIGCVWTQVNSANISGVSYSGTLTDTPPSANTYYYGIHVLDTAAPTPNIGYEPSPIKVTVTTSCTAGCVGDGVADDTTCLQNLFNSSCATVTLPAGKIYKVTSALSVPGNKTIIGSASTIITQDDTNQLIYISGSNVTLRNIHLTYQPPAFNINRGLIVNLGPSVKNIIVDNCVLSGAYAIVGVHINNPDIENVTIADNEFNNMYYGVLYNTTNFNATQRQDYNMHLSGLTVSGNKMYGLQGDGVAINSPVYAYSPYCSGGSGVSANNITISNNEIYAPNSKMIAYGFCVSVAGAVDVVISENSLINCKWQGVHIEDSADNVTVIRNYIYNIIGSESDDLESWTSGRAGVWVAGSKNIWILDNHIEKTIDEGILLIPSTTLYLPCSTSYPRYNNTCAISANRVIDAGTYGISVGGPDGIDVNFYIGPIAAQSLAGNNVIGSGIAPYILNGSPTGVTVTGNSW